MEMRVQSIDGLAEIQLAGVYWRLESRKYYIHINPDMFVAVSHK